MGETSVDLFADRLNTQKSKYVSWKSDPNAIAVDALSLQWLGIKGYEFPPFCLIGKSLAKVQKEGATIITITPTWQSQVWYPTLLRLSIATPLLLPPHKDLMTSPEGRVHPLMENKQLRLAAWKVSGTVSLRKAFHRTLQNYVCKPEGREHRLLTRPPGDSGLAGVANGKLIPFRRT